MAYTIQFYTTTWVKEHTVDLDSTIFDPEQINLTLVQEFVQLQRANRRQSPAHTKDRWEVNFSNRKLFKQKWTWQARPGNLKSPLRKQWWAVFGPKNLTNWTKKMTQKSRRRALLSCLLIKLRDDTVVWLTSYDLGIKTKLAVKTLESLQTSSHTLVIIDTKNPVIEKSFANIPHVKTITANYLNPLDVLHAKNLIFVWDALTTVTSLFSWDR